MSSRQPSVTKNGVKVRLENADACENDPDILSEDISVPLQSSMKRTSQ